MSSSLYQECLLVILRKHVFTVPSVSLLSMAVVGLVPPVLLEVEAQPSCLDCLWCLRSSEPLLYWWVLESTQKRVLSLLSFRLDMCV